MEEKEVRELLIKILYYTLNDIEADRTFKEKLTPDALVSLYRLAKQHSVSHVLSMFVYRSNVEVDPEMQNRLMREEFNSVLRFEQMKRAFSQICQLFDGSEIAYIPLKGSIIRTYYPIENMRTSCDIDILIHEEDLETAISVLEQNGYTKGERHYHDVSLYSQNNVHLELHFSLKENMENLDSVLKNAWDYASCDGGSGYKFSNEFFSFHIFAHMAYHFLAGGCGIRSLMDIWVLSHKMGLTYSDAQELLNRSGIYKFAEEMSRIAENCFTNNSTDSFSDTVLNYIFDGGVYGNLENKIAIKKAKGCGFISYLRDRLFLPYKSMVIHYPVLKKCPILLPLCWVARWVKALFGGKSKKVAYEMSKISDMPEEKLIEIRDICARLGL